MTTLFALWLLGACQQPTEAPAAPSAPSAADRDALQTRLAARHHVSCEALVDGLADPRGALRDAVDTMQYPAWAPMLAGRCLAELYATEEEATLQTWVRDPGKQGLRRTIARGLEARPIDPALRERILGPDATRDAAPVAR